jgi:hypothetical protein
MCVDIPTYHCLYLSNLHQEMGLGKTLSVLALIAWFLDTLENESLSAQRSIPRARGEFDDEMNGSRVNRGGGMLLGIRRVAGEVFARAFPMPYQRCMIKASG